MQLFDATLLALGCHGDHAEQLGELLSLQLPVGVEKGLGLRERVAHQVTEAVGDKIRALRKQKKLSLEQLAELTDSSKSYIWELENKDDPKPSADKIGKIAAVLDVTTEFLLTESATTPDEQVLDEAFFRKYKTMSEPDKKKIRKILDAWEDE